MSSFSRSATFGLRYAPEHPRSARKASQSAERRIMNYALCIKNYVL